MSALRLILLAIAIPLFGLIWWWSARQLKRAQDQNDSVDEASSWNRKGLLDEVPLEAEASLASPPLESTQAVEPVLAEDAAASRSSLRDPLADLPVIEVPAEAVSQWEHHEGPIEVRKGYVEELPSWLMVDPPAEVPLPSAATAADHRAPEVAVESPKAPAIPERIISIRVPFQGRTVSGIRLKMWFEQEGLKFATHQLFHKIVDGQSHFMVANLHNPGVFDPKTLEAKQYSGLTFFAVFPGPRTISAQARFDDLFECARRVAEQLGGVLHTDDGSEFSVALMMKLREELASYDQAHA